MPMNTSDVTEYSFGRKRNDKGFFDSWFWIIILFCGFFFVFWGGFSGGFGGGFGGGF